MYKTFRIHKNSMGILARSDVKVKGIVNRSLKNKSLHFAGKTFVIGYQTIESVPCLPFLTYPLLMHLTAGQMQTHSEHVTIGNHL